MAEGGETVSQLGRNGLHRRPLPRILTAMLLHQSNGTLTDFRRKFVVLAHGSIFSKVGASSKLNKPTKAAPKIKPELAEPIKTMIEESPSFGYRTVAALLGMNKNTVQRIFQLKGWQVKKRTIGFRPRIQA